MRISTSQLYSEATRNMMDGQSKLADIQAKIASGKNFTSLAENPVAANQVVNLKREIAQFDVFATNIDATRRRLDLEETTLDSLNNAVIRSQELLIQASNDTYTDADRRAISYELEELIDYAASLMNTRDAKGEYIFSGSKGTTQTYIQNADGSYTYQGDDTRRQIQVGSSQYLESTDTGQFLFEAIPGALELNTLGGANSPLLANALVDITVTDEAAFDNFMRSAGDLSLSVSRINNGSGGLVYSLVDSAGTPIESSDAGTFLNVPYSDSEATPNQLQVSVSGAILTLALPSDADVRDEPTLTEINPLLIPFSSDITDIASMQSQFESAGPFELEVSLVNDQGTLSDTSDDEYSYTLLNREGNTVVDRNGNPVSGSFTGVGAPEVAELDGWDISFTPDASSGTQLTLSIDPALQLPGLRLVGEEDSLITDVRISDSTDFATYMVGGGAGVEGAGDLSLSVTYSESTGYEWTLSNSQGILLENGSYQDPSEGVFTSAFSGTEASAVTPLTVTAGVSFSIEVNGLRSNTLSLTGGAFTSMGDIVADIQAQVDTDPDLVSAGIVVGYSSSDGFTFTATADPTAQLQLANVDGTLTTELGLRNTTNRFTLESFDGAEFDVTLPIEQEDSDLTFAYVPPAETTLRLKQERTNVLSTLADTVEAIRTLTNVDETERAKLKEQLATTLTGLTLVQERISQSVAGIGARLNAMDSAEFSNEDFKLLTEATLSSVEDLDYASAATELSKRQLALEAAYSSFAKIQGLSLFNYIN